MSERARSALGARVLMTTLLGAAMTAAGHARAGGALLELDEQPHGDGFVLRSGLNMVFFTRHGGRVEVVGAGHHHQIDVPGPGGDALELAERELRAAIGAVITGRWY